MTSRPAGRIHPTRWGAPTAIALVGAVLGYLVIELWYPVLPPLPWTAVPTIVLAAGAEFLAALYIRHGPDSWEARPALEPLAMARMLAIAKASIAAAALLAGAFLGVLLALTPRLRAPAPGVDAAVAAGTALAALLLLAAGLALERACRAPQPKDD